MLPQSYQYPNLSEGADRVGGQMRRDKECPFSGVTKSGRVWRKVPESDARSLEEGARKRCSECAISSVSVSGIATVSIITIIDCSHMHYWLVDEKFK